MNIAQNRKKHSAGWAFAILGVTAALLNTAAVPAAVIIVCLVLIGYLNPRD